MSDPNAPEDRSVGSPGPPPSFTGGTPSAPDAAPPGFADYRALGKPDIAGAPPPLRAEPSRQAKGRGLLPLVVAIVAIAAVAIGAFVLLSGGSDDDAPADGPGRAVLGWAQHMADQDYAGACKRLAAASVEQIAPDGASCATALEALDPDRLYRDAGTAEVVKVDIDGATAQVTLSGGGAALDGKVIVAVKTDGAWKASPFEDEGGDGSSTDPTPAPNPRDDVDGASSAACDASLTTVETAAAAYEALNGEPAADLQALVDGGFLSEVPSDVELTADGSVRGTGPCA